MATDHGDSTAGRRAGVTWPTAWRGRTVVCVATGPSLDATQVSAIRAARAAGVVRVVAVNDAGLSFREPTAASFADIWYAPDERFWRSYREHALRTRALRVSADAWPVAQGIAQLQLKCCMRGDPGYELARANVIGYAVHALHAGAQALQLAVSLTMCEAAARVVLIGYDCKPKGQDTNYFGRKPKELWSQQRNPNSPWSAWPAEYGKLTFPSGVEVLNATPDSLIDCFRRVTLEEALCGY